MRPDQRWFPTNRTERAAWFRNFATQFSQIGVSLGFTPDEIDSVTADNAVLQFAVSSITQLDATMRAAREFERLITGGADNGVQPDFPGAGTLLSPSPVPPATVPSDAEAASVRTRVSALRTPPPMVTAGIFARLEAIVRRIRVAPGYTPSIGALLGIIPTNLHVNRPGDFVPALKVWPDASPYTFWVRCSKQTFTGFEVSYKRSGSAEWEKSVTLTSSPANLTIVPATPGVPEKLEVKVRMVKGNYPVTNFSTITTVTVNP